MAGPEKLLKDNYLNDVNCDTLIYQKSETIKKLPE